MAELDKSFVVDASITIAWILNDERQDQTDAIYDGAIDNKTELIAPELLLSEILNSLRSAAIRERINSNQAIQSLLRFHSLQITRIPMNQLSEQVLKIALKHNISSYDAEYVALARHYKTTLYTTDTRLARKVKNAVDVKVIG